MCHGWLGNCRVTFTWTDVVESRIELNWVLGLYAWFSCVVVKHFFTFLNKAMGSAFGFFVSFMRFR